MNKLFTELRRRNIFRVAGVYALVGWLLMQIVSVMTPAGVKRTETISGGERVVAKTDRMLDVVIIAVQTRWRG